MMTIRHSIQPLEGIFYVPFLYFEGNVARLKHSSVYEIMYVQKMLRPKLND